MKTMVTKGGITVWLSSRENQFIQEHFSEDKLLEKQNLNERDCYIAQSLVTKGVLDKDINNKQVAYKLKTNKMAK